MEEIDLNETNQQFDDDEKWADNDIDEEEEEEEIEISPRQDFIAFLEALPSMDDNFCRQQLRNFRNEVILKEKPENAFSHFTPDLFRSLFEQICSRSIFVLINFSI